MSALKRVPTSKQASKCLATDDCRPGYVVSCQVFRCTLPRVELRLDDYPQIKRIYNNCLKLPQVQKAMPQQQPDAPDVSFYMSSDG